MNSYKRYTALLSGKPADILPCIPIVMHFAAEYINKTYADFASDYNVLVEANSACARDFSFDQLSVISDPYRETHGFGAEIKYHANRVPECICPPLFGSKDLSLLKAPNPLTSERMLDRVNGIKLFHEKYNKQYSILGWVEGPAASAATLRSVGNFLIDIIDDIPFTEKLMDVCTQTAIEFAKAQITNGADTIGIGDAIASQVSPDIYEKIILPREKQLVDAIHDAGAYVRLHICGNITHLLPGIAELDVDILDVDSMVDLKITRNNVGTKVVIAGNIDPVRNIKMGTPIDIQDHVLKNYNDAGNPFMINAGCEIPAATPHENLKALCKPIAYKAY